MNDKDDNLADNAQFHFAWRPCGTCWDIFGKENKLLVKYGRQVVHATFQPRSEAKDGSTITLSQFIEYEHCRVGALCLTEVDTMLLQDLLSKHFPLLPATTLPAPNSSPVSGSTGTAGQPMIEDGAGGRH